MQISDYIIAGSDEIASPALIYYEDIIRENTRAAIALAGGADRLWPHIKTHKMAQMVNMQREMGIERFKCATIAELNMAASCGARQLLMAYPLVGPNIGLFLDAVKRWPGTHMYALGDSVKALNALNAAASARGMHVDWFADVNMGMDRTGVPVYKLPEFCVECAGFEALNFVGLHCYDGNLHSGDAAARAQAVEAEMARVMAARARLSQSGVRPGMIIAGGSPTFPCHARENGVFLSPGTVFVWDYGYARNYPELPFRPGAAILTRVVSNPTGGVFTLDLGYKAICADPQGLRGLLLGVDAEPMFQSEEHWTWRASVGQPVPNVGDALYVIPTHICPTTALYRSALVAKAGKIEGEWLVAARDRR